jgi:hypothetical protein
LSIQSLEPYSAATVAVFVYTTSRGKHPHEIILEDSSSGVVERIDSWEDYESNFEN